MIYMVPHNCVRLNFRVRLTKPFKNFTYYETSGKGIVVFLYIGVHGLMQSPCPFVLVLVTISSPFLAPIGDMTICCIGISLMRYRSGISGLLLTGVLITYTCDLIQSCSSHLPDQLSRQMVDQPVAPLCQSLTYNW